MINIYEVAPEYNPKYLDLVKKYYAAPNDKRIYFTRSVRNATPESIKKASELIQKGSLDGKIYYDPYTMTEQDKDKNGITITSTNKKAIEYCFEVEEELDVESKGSAWDNGMTFMLDKPIKILNKEYLTKEVLLDRKHRIYSSLIAEIAENVNINYANRKSIITELNKLQVHKDLMRIDKKMVADFTWKEHDNIDLLKLGMVFAAGVPIKINNINAIEPTPGKSHENVLHEMHRLSQIYLMESDIKPQDLHYVKIN